MYGALANLLIPVFLFAAEKLSSSVGLLVKYFSFLHFRARSLSDDFSDGAKDVLRLFGRLQGFVDYSLNYSNLEVFEDSSLHHLSFLASD